MGRILRKNKEDTKPDTIVQEFSDNHVNAYVELAQAMMSLPNLNNILSETQKNVIKIPGGYREKVIAVKELLKNDGSGMVDSTLDFIINSCALDYTISSKNTTTESILNYWLSEINGKVRGRVPTGAKNLSKEYFREVYKGSSNILLRTVWEYVEINGSTYELPTLMWFVDGKDIVIETDQETQALGKEKYYLSVKKNNKISLPAMTNEKIYVQRPFEQWGEFYPTPFLIKRGLYKNLSFYNLLLNKIEVIVQSALEYLLVIKKSTENMLLQNKTYSEERLKQIGEEFAKLYRGYDNVRYGSKLPISLNLADTDLEHFIPKYEEVLKATLFTALNQRLLHGLGLVEHVKNIDGTVGRESNYNPKMFIRELKNGISNFVSLMNDVIKDIEERNKLSNRKLFSNKNNTKMKTPILVDFISDKILNYTRSVWDRGALGTKEWLESTTEYKYEDQVDERKLEIERGEDKIMYPRKTQNLDSKINQKSVPKELDKNSNSIPDDKVNDSEKLNYSFAMYKSIKDLPSNLDVLPSDAKTIYKNVFNDNYSKGETIARKIAWTAVKNGFKKNKNGEWIKKE